MGKGGVNDRLAMTDCQLRVTLLRCASGGQAGRFRVTGYRLQVTGYRLQVTNFHILTLPHSHTSTFPHFHISTFQCSMLSKGHKKRGKLLTSHRSTTYPCYLPVLGDSAGAGRVRLTPRGKGIIPRFQADRSI